MGAMSGLTDLLKIICYSLFVFTTVSYIAGAATDGLTTLLRRRETLLARAVAQLLGDTRFDGLALEVYNNALINPLGNGAAANKAELGPLPAWIDPVLFATALLEVLHMIPNAVPSIGKIQPLSVDATLPRTTRIENAVTNATRRIGADAEIEGKANNLVQLMANLIRRCEGRQELMEQWVALWFDAAMQAVTEQYRKETKLWNFAIGFGIAALLDLQPIPLTGMLARPEAQGAQVGPLMASLFEWGVVALATLFGAQLWFGLLHSAARRRRRKYTVISAAAAPPPAETVLQLAPPAGPGPTPAPARRKSRTAATTDTP
jgi:hypothetical protein